MKKINQNLIKHNKKKNDRRDVLQKKIIALESVIFNLEKKLDKQNYNTLKNKIISYKSEFINFFIKSYRLIIFIFVRFRIQTLLNLDKKRLSRILKNVRLYFTNSTQEKNRLSSDFTQQENITVIIPVYNTPINFLRKCISSVLDQTINNWNLIISVDECNDSVNKYLVDLNASYTKIKVINNETSTGISNNLNNALKSVDTDYFFVLDHDDLIDPCAIEILSFELSKKRFDYIYSDEAKITEGNVKFGYFFKPDWSPYNLLANMYSCHLSLFKKEIAERIGGYNSDFDGCQDFDFLLRYIASKDVSVSHIPKCLYYWRAWSKSTAQSLSAKPLAYQRQKNALKNFLDNQGVNFTLNPSKIEGSHLVKFIPKKNDLVSIVIPTANKSIMIDGDKKLHIDEVVKSIETSNYSNYEIIIIHNNDLSKSQHSVFNKNKRIKLVTYNEKKFNLANKINLGVTNTIGEYLILLNDDIRIITKSWIEDMLGIFQLKNVGAVGAKLLFPNDSIQHAGVTLLNGLPGHPYYENDSNYYGHNGNVHNLTHYSAVTGACMMTKKSIFNAVGGFDPIFPLNYNDVDYCLKLFEKGYYSIYYPVEMYHYEGVSKKGGRSVSKKEIKTFLSRYGKKFKNDPFYNINLNQSFPYG